MKSIEQILARLGREIAWVGTAGPTKLARTPTVQEVVAESDRIIQVSMFIHDMLNETKHMDVDKVRSKLQVLYQLYGYDPYTGALYRSVPIKSLKHTRPAEGDIIRMAKAGPKPTTSWTTSISNAVKYGATSLSFAGYAVLELLDSGLQLINFPYLNLVLKHLYTVVPRGASTSDLRYAIKDNLDMLEVRRAEDEILMVVKPNSRMRIVLLSEPSHDNKPVRRSTSSL